MDMLKWLADSVTPMVTTGSGKTVIAAGFCCLTHSYWSAMGTEPETDADDRETFQPIAPA